MAQRFVETDRQSAPLFSRYPEEHVEPDSLAAFVRDMVESTDLSSLEGKYSARGRRAHSPRCLMAAWIYGYATGISSSRKLEEACRYDLRLHYVTDGVRPDHDTLNRFRKACRKELDDLLEQTLERAAERGLVDVSRVCVDGTKMKANASLSRNLTTRHSAQEALAHTAQLRELLDKIDESCGADAESRQVCERGVDALERRARRDRAALGGLGRQRVGKTLRKRLKQGQKSAKKAEFPEKFLPERRSAPNAPRQIGIRS